jgi:hypothetical protein
MRRSAKIEGDQAGMARHSAANSPSRIMPGRRHAAGFGVVGGFSLAYMQRSNVVCGAARDAKMPAWLQIVLFFSGAWGTLGLFVWGVLALPHAPSDQK